MNDPTIYIVCSKYPITAEALEESEIFSNLDYGKELAIKCARASHKPHTIYQLVPIYHVDVKVNYDFPITEYPQS